jgi:hypothetical protein
MCLRATCSPKPETVDIRAEPPDEGGFAGIHSAQLIRAFHSGLRFSEGAACGSWMTTSVTLKRGRGMRILTDLPKMQRR